MLTVSTTQGQDPMPKLTSPWRLASPAFAIQNKESSPDRQPHLKNTLKVTGANTVSLLAGHRLAEIQSLGSQAKTFWSAADTEKAQRGTNSAALTPRV